MSSASASAAALLAEYWSDDFRPLEDAGLMIRRALREDEAAGDADIYRQLTDNNGKHLYFMSGEDDSEQRIVHKKSIPLPPLIVDEIRQNIKNYSFMGILTPASLVWVTCDKKLFLWPFEKKAGAHTFEANAPIITVGLVKPKKDLLPDVEWILVVTTPDEVMQLLLYKSEDDTAFKICASSFNLPTDNVRMLSVAGTDSGRIFLGGDDGSLFEVVYQSDNANAYHKTEEEILSDFYDKGLEVDETICVDGASSVAGTFVSLGKRSMGLDGTGTSASAPRRAHKCRKVNRTSSSWVSAIVPDGLLNAAGFLFGGKSATGGGPIVKMVVDEQRQTLYTLSRSGSICSFALQKDNVHLTAVMDTPRIVQLYLEAVSRGQMSPPSGGSFGYMSFNGNGLAAQAGVGGMEGARTLLKNAEMRMNRAKGKGQKYDSSLVPVSIHVISPAESQRLTLLAVTGCGLRLYLSSLLPNSRSLLPSKHLTLCHIRVPPPTDARQELSSSADESGFMGGFKPHVLELGKGLRVDASFYKGGIFMAAVETQTAQQDGRNPLVGDTIIATYADSSFRAVDRTGRDGDDRDEKSAVPGGIVESIRLPLNQVNRSGAGGASLLPGGFVVQIAKFVDNEGVGMKLARNSLTPSDSELGIGLPSEYCPPSQKRSHRQPAANGGKDTASIVVSSQTFTGVVVSLMTKVLPGSVLAKMSGQGVTIPVHSSQRLYGAASKDALYRVSGRDAEEGYSSTAAEKSRYSLQPVSREGTGQRTTSKSVRLGTWLLKPAAVPLNQLATLQFAEPTTDVFALNAGGLHYFGLHTVLQSLADALRSAGENATSDPAVTSFFMKYGYKEGCAMCLSLAAGCGPAVGQSTGAEQLRGRAFSAAFARGFTPKLLRRSADEPASAGTSAYSPDPAYSLVPSGYDFCPSELFKGFIALMSRLLRPVWYKPAIVITEGRTIKSAWTKAVRATPAKVEVLLSREKLEQIHKPLANLLHLMKKLFYRALTTVPGMSQDQTSMDIDDGVNEQSYITANLARHIQIRAEMNGTSHVLSTVDAERLARLIEEREVHALYRLCSRAVQVLNLMLLLSKAHEMSELNEVDWGLLHGLTFAQLSETRDGQDRVERLLNSLMIASAADGFGNVAPTIAVDQLASQFSAQCYSFFTPGLRSSFLGFVRANEALEHPTGSVRLSLTQQCGKYFRNAAEHWSSASIITGRILHSRGQESYKDIALRAFQYQSPLATAVDLLIRLGDIATAVEICLRTASNFQANDSSRSAWPFEEVSSGGAFPWEQQLYRKPVDTDVSNVSTSRMSRSSSSSPTQIIAGGLSVTSKDAVDTCYSLIFYSFSALMSSNRDQAYAFVSACTATSDEVFLWRFFSFLLDNGYVETLLLIDSPFVEKWVKESDDSDLLWRYYTVQNLIAEAGQVALSHATKADSSVSLNDRIQHLSRAEISFKSKLKKARNIGLNSTEESLQRALSECEEKMKLTEDLLAMARIQKRLLSTVDARRKLDESFEMDSLLYEKLTSQLVSASDLFNEFAFPFSFFEYCLLILHACKHKEESATEDLWSNVIAKEVLPCATRNDDIFGKLQDLFKNCLEDGESIKLLTPGESSDSLWLFEEGDWSRRVEAKIVELGLELYGTGADYVFPVHFLLRKMEELREAARGSVPPSWPLMTLARSGVPYLILFDEYDSFCNKRANGGGETTVVQLQTCVDLLASWFESARHGIVGASGNARERLIHAIGDGSLSTRIDRLRASIQSHQAEAHLLQRLDMIESTMRYSYNNM